MGSFPHRNIRNLVIRNVSMDQSGSEFLELCKSSVKSSSSLPPPFKTYQYDCLKIEHQAHGSKTSDPVVNTDIEPLDLTLSLKDSNVKNETELSLFRRSDYDEYKEGPSKGQNVVTFLAFIESLTIFEKFLNS